MPVNDRQTLKDLQEEVRAIRQEAKQAMQEVLELERQIQQKEETVTASFRLKNTAEGRLGNEVLQQLKADKAAAYQVHRQQSDLLNGKLRELQTSTDPRDLVQLLDDHYPVFLMPVRLETRFMTIKHIARVAVPANSSGSQNVSDLFNGRDDVPVIQDRKELWVRIFPDDIFMQSHEEALTEAEITAGRFFWTEMQAAHQINVQQGGSESEEEWVARQAVEVENHQTGAWRGLVSGRGQERAAWVAIQLTPTNVDELAKVVELVFPEVNTKAKSWSKAPQTDMLPDRFVIKLVFRNTKREVVGNPVTAPLHLSISPLEEDETIEPGEGPAEGLLKFPPQLKWLTDFHEAEKVGMAIRIPLSNQEAQQGFDRVLALGIRSSLSPFDGQTELSQLFDNHLFTDGGMSVLPQGTATNNSERASSGYTAFDNDDEDYFKVAQQQALFTATDTPGLKTDGQQLGEKLALNEETSRRIKAGDTTDLQEAKAMNRVLWPVSFGYYLQQMLFPLVTKETAGAIRGFFEEHVLGRGHLPAIRIDDQPYGLLVSTAFRQWEAHEEEDAEVKDKLFRNLLQNMEETWSRLSRRVRHTNMDGDPDELFLSIMSKHASSVEFYQRNAVGRLFLWNLHNLLSTLNSTEVPAGFENIEGINVLDFLERFSWLDGQVTVPPNIFDLVYTKEPQLLNGPFVDVLPSSEENKLAEIAPGWNYLRWLRETTWQQLKDEDFSMTEAEAAAPPTALFYLLARHALLLEYQQAGLNYLEQQGVVVPGGSRDNEVTNLGELSKESRLADLHKRISQEEISRQRHQIDTELDNHLLNFAGSEAERLEEANFFRTERLSELAGALQQNIEEGVEAAALNLESKSVAEIFQSAHGDLTDNQPLHVYVETLLERKDESVATLTRLKEALQLLEHCSTAQLERCLSEHIDLGTYRLDAWFSGLANDRLESLRKAKENDPGTYIGAFGWLLNLRPGSFPGIHFEEISVNQRHIHFTESAGVRLDRKIGRGAVPFPSLMTTGEQTLLYDQTRTKININRPDLVLDNKLKQTPAYVYLGQPSSGEVQASAQYDTINNRFIAPPRTDPANQGFIHAPSINQATAAAVLRAAYEAHRTNNSDNAYAVNINSKRVRKAIFLLEGIQNGQTLGALLGYQFERKLNDQTTANLNLNQYVYDLRVAFPQIAGSVTETDGTTSPGEAEAYQVIDGLKLLEAYRESPNEVFNDIDLNQDNNEVAILEALEAAVDELADAVDAIYDLMMAESVFQVTQGNAARAGASLKMLNGKGTYTDPEVIRTPRSYHTLTHRIGLQFDHSTDGSRSWSNGSTVLPASPRSLTAPKLNSWLSTVLPAPEKMIIAVSYTDIPAGSPVMAPAKGISVAALGIQPIDFYFLMLGNEKGVTLTRLARVAEMHVREHLAKSDKVKFDLDFKATEELNPGAYSISSILPLMEQIKQILGRARPLSPDDLVLPSELESLEQHEENGWLTEELIVQVRRLVSDEAEDKDYSLLKLQQELAAALESVQAIDLEDLGNADRSAVSSLRDTIVRFSFFAFADHYPGTAWLEDAPTIEALIAQAVTVKKQIEKRLVTANQLLGKLNEELSKEEIVDTCQEVGKAIFGRAFKLFPAFKQYQAEQYQVVFDYEDWLAEAGDPALDQWWQTVARTNEGANAWHLLDLFTDSIYQKKICKTKVVQLPLEPIDENGQAVARWLGVEYPEGYDVPDENLSIVFQYPDQFQADQVQSGILIDSWNEEIPIKDSTTGIALHYNSPNSEPPQTCLLAVTPKVTGQWSWDDLMDTLEETIDWAKKRGVDPDLLDDTPYAQVLPTIMAALAADEGTVSLDLKRNIVQNPIPGTSGPIILQNYQVIQGYVFNNLGGNNFEGDDDNP